MNVWERTSQRTVKCRTCGVRDYYVWSDGRMNELRDRDGNPHICTAQTAQPTATAPAPVVTPAAPIANVVSAAPIATNSDPVYLAELKALIPDADNVKTYIPRKLNGHTDLDTMVLAYQTNVAHMTHGMSCPTTCPPKCKRRPINVRMISDTGAGKNHLWRAVAAKLGVPYLRIIASAATVDSLFGRLQVTERNGAPVTEWQDGRVSMVCRPSNPLGAIVFIDEINATPQSVGFMFHSLLDDERLCILDDHSEAFKIGAGVMFVSAMNPDYAGTRSMNAALSNRFGLTVPLDYEDSIEKKLIKDDRLLKIAKQLRVSYRQGDGTINTPVGTRTLLDYEQNVGIFGREIANASFVAQFETNDEQVAVRQALELHLTDATPINVDADVNLDDA